MSENPSEGSVSHLNKLSLDLKIVSSPVATQLFESQSYCYKPKTLVSPKYTTGDLRAKGTFTKVLVDILDMKTENIIAKYVGRRIMLYREGLLHLRYAEAVNRAGKPGLAFAVLKVGLDKAVLGNTSLVPAQEIADEKTYATIFKSDIFGPSVSGEKSNFGIHSRGSGNAEASGVYKIPTGVQLTSLGMDSITYVENAICDELALETCFEGNRFQDLMRMAGHRNDPSFLANKVAAKHKDADRVKALLLDKKNWFIPVKK